MIDDDQVVPYKTWFFNSLQLTATAHLDKTHFEGAHDKQGLHKFV